MRELKFRGWDKKHKSMTEINNHFMYLNGSLMVVGGKDNTGSWSAPRANYELMQYTGLSDKNGVEIYEGDIVKCSHHNEKAISEVKFIDGCFIISGFYIDASWDFPLEVIGNRYENPDITIRYIAGTKSLKEDTACKNGHQ